MKATRPPMVSEWWLIANAPRTTLIAITAFGTRLSVDQKMPSTTAISIRVWPSSAAWARCASRRLGAAAERLQHPDAGRRLLDQRGQVAVLVLGPPGEDLVPPLEPGAEDEHRGEQDGR